MNNLNEWLKLNKIGYIISIDDLHNEEITNTDRLVLFKNGLRKDFDKYSKPFKPMIQLWENIDIYRDNVDAFVNIYENLIDNKENMGIIKEVDKLLEDDYKPTNTAIRELVIQLQELAKDDKNPIQEFKLYKSYDEVIKNYDEYLSNINHNFKVLWLVDFELEGKDDKRNGIELIKKILEHNKNNREFIENNIFSILSSQIGENHDLEDIYRRVYVIDKQTLSDRVEFSNKIITGSKSYISSVLVGDIVKRLKDGLNNAKDRLLRESLEILDYLIISYPNQEGTHPLELLLRIFNIISKAEFENSISSDIPQVFKLLNEYELMCGDNKVEERKSDFINECFKIEKYNDNINVLYNSINSGDIFKIFGHYYILITQPCDLAVRNDGNRSSEYGILLRIDKGNSSSKFSYPLNYFKSTPYYIDLKVQMHIDLDILDLCILNKDGYSKLNSKVIDDKFKEFLELEESDEERIILYFKELIEASYVEGYFNRPNKLKLIRVIKKVYNSYKGIKEIKDLIPEDKHNIVEHIIGNSEDLVNFNKFKVEDGYIKYDIQRVTNLNSVVTSDLISKFSNYISRIGKPGVFADNIDKETKTFKIYIEDICNGEDVLIEQLDLRNEIEIIQNKIAERYKGIVNAKNIKKLNPELDSIKITGDLQVVNICGQPFNLKGSKNNYTISLSLKELQSIDGGNELIATLEEIATSIEEGNIDNPKKFAKYYDDEINAIRPKFNFPYKKEERLLNNLFLIKANLNREKLVNVGEIIMKTQF
ncbi:hypothetical protein [Sporosalibacterium faouarense]|uniref:hypothetical protein n=1 Tax=Sporosalibacterium faouarense TaxID=516123 RepID=UPI00192B87FF|nr:hypothetical protein [Sporosalibacterium faouarense]